MITADDIFAAAAEADWAHLPYNAVTDVTVGGHRYTVTVPRREDKRALLVFHVDLPDVVPQIYASPEQDAAIRRAAFGRTD